MDKKIAVIHGGTSSEADISTQNAHYIAQALERLGCTVLDVPYDRAMYRTLLEEAPDGAFLCVQGKGHGDGTLQGILDHLGIPYTGSGREAATVINNKILCQTLFRLAGLPVPRNVLWTAAEQAAADGPARFEQKLKKAGFGFPCVAKAPTQGGSFGVEYLASLRRYPAMEGVLAYDDPILVEQFIPGHFVTVGLLERRGELLAFPVMQGDSLVDDPDGTVYDSQDYFRPAHLPPETEAELQELARRAFRVVNARGYARVDFMYDRNGARTPYLLEINAVPGLKPTSLFPPAAEMAGVPYDEMIGTILEDCLERREPGCSEI